MKYISMGLNTTPDWTRADELIAKGNAEGNQPFVEMWKRMKDTSIALRDEIIKTVEDEGECEIGWSCTGATLFDCLAYQWSKAIPQYRFEIGRYSCKVFKS